MLQVESFGWKRRSEEKKQEELFIAQTKKTTKCRSYHLWHHAMQFRFGPRLERTEQQSAKEATDELRNHIHASEPGLQESKARESKSVKSVVVIGANWCPGSAQNKTAQSKLKQTVIQCKKWCYLANESKSI